jgi:hypothetical protein
MLATVFLERLFKWLLIGSLAVVGMTYFHKDRLPYPSYYNLDDLSAPKQGPTSHMPFTTHVNDQVYQIEPRFSYELHGIVVSYHNADSIFDIWHHSRYKDFINLRDLCVIWGNNVRSGVYLDMEFWNESWTCFSLAPDRTIWKRFQEDQLSNNHLLADRPGVRDAVMSAELGDHIRLKGVLAEYRNPGTGFYRGTSTARTDRGNGSCETVYVEEFEIISKANPGIRRLHRFAKWMAIMGLIGFVVMFIRAPPQVSGRLP